MAAMGDASGIASGPRRAVAYTLLMQDSSAAPNGRAAVLPLPAVVLAAGFGSRLGAAARGLPKALAPVAGRALLAHTLAALAEAGVRDVCVVTGHRGTEIERALPSMTPRGLQVVPARNPHFHRPNGSSLAAARGWTAARPFLLLMADHLLSAEAVSRMLAAPSGNAVGIDRSPLPAEQIEEATKALLDADGRVTALGKQLPRWDAIDAGIFRLEPDVFEELDRLGGAPELSALMTAVAAGTPLHAVNLSGAFWLDVDTPADLAAAEAALARIAG
jgi:choline kinase